MEDPEPAVLPVKRFDWERLLRRIRMPNPVRGTGFLLATYADIDGTRVRPGIERLTVVSGVNEKTIRRHIAALRDMELIQRTKHGNRHAKQADEYRLTVPADALVRLAMLDPDECLTIVCRTPVSARQEAEPASTAMSTGHPDNVYRTFGAGLPDTGAHPPDHLHKATNQTRTSPSEVTTDCGTNETPTKLPRPGHSDGYLAAVAILAERRAAKA